MRYLIVWNPIILVCVQGIFWMLGLLQNDPNAAAHGPGLVPGAT